MADYIWKKGKRLKLVEGEPDEGEASYAEEQIPLPVEREKQHQELIQAQANKITKKLADGNATDYVLARLIFEILKANKTDDWSFFSGVTNATTYKEFLRDLITDRLNGR